MTTPQSICNDNQPWIGYKIVLYLVVYGDGVLGISMTSLCESGSKLLLTTILDACELLSST